MLSVSIFLIPCGLSASELPAFSLQSLSGYLDCNNAGWSRVPQPDKLDTVTLQVSENKQVFGNYASAHTYSEPDVLAKFMCVSKINDVHASCFKGEKDTVFSKIMRLLHFCINFNIRR